MTLAKTKTTPVRWFTPEATARIQIDIATRAGHRGFATNLTAVACGTAWGVIAIATLQPAPAVALAVAAVAGFLIAATLNQAATINHWATKHNGHDEFRCLQDERIWRVQLVRLGWSTSWIALACTIASTAWAVIA